MGLFVSPLGVGVMAGLAVLLLFWGFQQLVRNRNSELLERVQPVRRRIVSRQEQAGASGEGGFLRRLSARLESGVGQLWLAEGIVLRLARADLALTVTEFLSICLASALVLYILVAMVSGMPLVGVLGGILGALVPFWYVNRQHQRRLRAFEEQLPDVIDLLVGALRAGFGISQAMEAVAANMPEPTSKEFARVVTEVRLGSSMATALDHLVSRIDSPDLNLLVTAVIIQQEVGGNLAGILETISGTIRDRIRVKGQIRVLTAEKRLTSYILGGLPFILAGILYMVNRDYMGQLFKPGVQRYLLVLFVFLEVMGFVIIRKIVDLKV